MTFVKPRIGLVAASVALAVGLFGGSAEAVRPLDTPPPYSGQGAPPKPPPSCKAVVAGLAGMKDTRSDYPQPICGTNDNDVLTATRGGGAIWGYRGNDTLRARNGSPDEVIGGDGTDSATIDESCDTTTSIEKITRKPGPCNGVTPFHSYMYGPTDYPAFEATLKCGMTSDGTRMMRFLEEPILRAVDATDKVDWQTVAWSGVIFKWDGAQWHPLGQSNWRWDRTYDMQVEAFPGNFWRLFTGQRTFLYFYPDSPGWYRFAILAHWYATPNVPAHDEAFWAGPHYGPFEDPTQTWCVYP
jgi:hypothetical protein